MPKRLVSTVWVQSPNAGTKAFGPQDREQDVPQWAKQQMGDHCWEEYDPADQALAAAGPDRQLENRDLQDQLVQLRADNDTLRAERDQHKAQLAERDSRIAELEGLLVANTQRNGEAYIPLRPSEAVDYDTLHKPELDKLAKERGIEVPEGAKKAEIIEALKAADEAPEQ